MNDKIFSGSKRIHPLLHPRVIAKLLDLSLVFAVFFTPLLFFIESRDQFELPKLTFLALLTVPFLLAASREDSKGRWTPLSLSLLALFAAQILSSLPSTSLSWRTSLLGDYENFAGLSTLAVYLAWFWAAGPRLTGERMEKLFYFICLAAFLSSLYAVGQHYGFDFIQWNPESVNSTREFASLGNPNFLSAFLAMTLPLFLCVSLRPLIDPGAKAAWPGISFWVLGLIGLGLTLLGTAKGLSLLGLPLSTPFAFFCRTAGLALFSITCVRLSQFRSWPVLIVGSAALFFGLFSTASRGGFLAAMIGVGLWAVLALRRTQWGEALRQRYSQVPRSYLYSSLFSLSVLLVLFGHSFLHRLFDSLLHAGTSLSVSRLHIWGPALGIVKANPWLGIGLDTFKIAFPFYSGIEFNLIDGMFMSSRMAHNELLQVASTTGLVGLAAYLAVLFSFGWMGWKAFQRAGPSGRWLLAALMASAAAYHVQNFFSFGVASINLVWFLFLAFLQGEYGEKFPSSRPEGPGSLPGARTAVFLLLAGLAFFFPLRRLGADIAYSRGGAISEFLKKPGPETTPEALKFYSDFAIRNLTKAADLMPLEVKYRLYLGLAFEQRAQIDAERSAEWRQRALDCYQRSTTMSPTNAYYYNNIGRQYDALGRSDPKYLLKAEESYRDAVKWAPANPFFIVNWAAALRKTGKEKEASEELRRSFQLDPGFTAKVLAQMAFENYRSGDKRTAFQQLDAALEGNTSNAETYYSRGILYLSEGEKKKALADFKRVQELHPDLEKNPSIRNLDQLMEQAGK